MNEYNKQAKDFLESTNVKFEADFTKNDFHFEDDKEKRDIYKITLQRGTRQFTFNFGQSINHSGKYRLYGKDMYNDITTMRRDATHGLDYDTNKEFAIPNEYDVLACLTKYDPETLEDFCNEFGYDTDSKKAEKIYNSVMNEYNNVCMLWNEFEIEKLAEIQ